MYVTLFKIQLVNSSFRRRYSYLLFWSVKETDWLSLALVLSTRWKQLSLYSLIFSFTYNVVPCAVFFLATLIPQGIHIWTCIWSKSFWVGIQFTHPYNLMRTTMSLRIFNWLSFVVFLSRSFVWHHRVRYVWQCFASLIYILWYCLGYWIIFFYVAVFFLQNPRTTLVLIADILFNVICLTNGNMFT